MHTVHSYWWFKNAISPENCERIINHGLQTLKRFKEMGVETQAVTVGGTEKGATYAGDEPLADKTYEESAQEEGVSQGEVRAKKYVRDCEVAWLSDKWLYDLVFPFIHKANMEAGWQYDVDYCGPVQFTIYRPGGFYGWHTDGFSCHYGIFQKYEPGITPLVNGNLPPGYVDDPNMAGKVRKLSATINLNEPGEYEGGNLKFDFGPHSKTERYHECEEIRPQGSIIVFPSFIYHQVTPVTKGTRYSLVFWLLGRPFK